MTCPRWVVSGELVHPEPKRTDGSNTIMIGTDHKQLTIGFVIRAILTRSVSRLCCRSFSMVPPSLTAFAGHLRRSARLCRSASGKAIGTRHRLIGGAGVIAFSPPESNGAI